MMNIRLFYLTIIVLFSISMGCSNHIDSPINISTSEDVISESLLPITQPDEKATNRMILGSWILDMNGKSNMVELKPDRYISAHYNVTSVLPPPSVKFISYDPLTAIIDLDVSINNSTALNAYDVRLIAFTNDHGIRLMNWDNWTALYDIAGGSLINPFRAYAKLAPNRIFAHHTKHTERLQFYMPGGSGSVLFVIDASFPSNCEEPYKIADFHHGVLYDVQGHSTLAKVDVYDWQNDINSVALYCRDITGNYWDYLEKATGNTWQLNLTNNENAPAGIYVGVIEAKSENSGVLALYELVKISITHSPYTPTSDWTFLIYMDEAFDLDDYAEPEINEIEVAGSRTGDLNIIVLWNKLNNPNDVILKIERDPEGYNSSIVSPELAHPDWIFPPTGLEMGNKATLEQFLKWSMKHYPAEKYAIVFWGHGDGPFNIQPDPGFVVKEGPGGLLIWDIRDACQGIINDNPYIEKFRIIGFDACLMSWIETAYCLSDVCEAGIASEMKEPNYGWTYDDPLNYLRDNISTCTVEELCRRFVDEYLNWDHPFQMGKTMAAWRSDKVIDVIVPLLNNFSDELIISLPEYKNIIANERIATGDWGGDMDGSCNQPHVKDLGYFAERISVNTELPLNLRNSAQTLRYYIDNYSDDDAMIRRGHYGAGLEKCPWRETGWQIWFPDDYWDWESRQIYYQYLGFDNTRWDEFLGSFDSDQPVVITHEVNKNANNTGKTFTYKGCNVNSSQIIWNGSGSWDFTVFGTTNTFTDEYIDPDSSEFSSFRSYYPTATTVFKSPGDMGSYYAPRYYDDSSSGYQCELGQESSYLGPGYGFKFDNPVKIPFPMQDGYSEYLVATGRLADILNFTFTFQIDAVGCGEVTTESGTLNCLLMRSYIVVTIQGMDEEYYVEYQWLSDDGIKVASATTQNFDPVTYIPVGIIKCNRLTAHN